MILQGCSDTHSFRSTSHRCPVFIAEVFPFLNEPVSLYSTPEILSNLRKYIFNDSICPDFHRLELPGGRGAALQYVEMQPLVSFVLENLQLTLIPGEPPRFPRRCAGRGRRCLILITSDTCRRTQSGRLPQDEEAESPSSADVSYPNEMEALAAVFRTSDATNVEGGAT